METQRLISCREQVPFWSLAPGGWGLSLDPGVPVALLWTRERTGVQVNAPWALWRDGCKDKQGGGGHDDSGGKCL